MARIIDGKRRLIKLSVDDVLELETENLYYLKPFAKIEPVVYNSCYGYQF